jgi:hypothetical protein
MWMYYVTCWMILLFMVGRGPTSIGRCCATSCVATSPPSGYSDHRLIQTLNVRGYTNWYLLTILDLFGVILSVCVCVNIHRFTWYNKDECESISSAALHRAAQHVDRWIFSWFESAQISKWSNGSRSVQRGTAQQRNRTRRVYCLSSKHHILSPSSTTEGDNRAGWVGVRFEFKFGLDQFNFLEKKQVRSGRVNLYVMFF